MKVVLDTNGFISCIGKRSAYRNVFDAYLAKRFTLCVSTEILFEYEEKFTAFWGVEVAENLMGRLMAGSNTSFYTVYFQFSLVKKDADDNKFADTYLASGADYLVTNDSDLLSLRNLSFPPLNVITLQEFSKLW